MQPPVVDRRQPAVPDDVPVILAGHDSDYRRCGGVRRTERGLPTGGTYKVNNANVVCGNVPTANATGYIIDPILMPK